MLAFGWFFPKLQPELRGRRRSPKEASRLIEFPLLQHSSLLSRSKVTRNFRPGRVRRVAVIEFESYRMPS